MIKRFTEAVLHTTAMAGTSAVGLFSYTGSLFLLFVQTVGGIFCVPLQVRAVLNEIWKVGVKSWMIIFLSSFFIGMVLALQSAYQMKQLGMEMYIASLVSLSVVREIGPVITALIVAGRVGSSIAAELGTMKVTEQLDALMTLATDPVRFLVVPRFLALIIVMPLLTLWADALAILGGFFIGTVQLDILPSLYWKLTTLPLVVKDLSSGLLKAFIFGMIICIVSCYEGFRTKGGAEGVGRATTAAVVSSFSLIIFADCIITALFYFVWN